MSMYLTKQFCRYIPIKDGSLKVTKQRISKGELKAKRELESPLQFLGETIQDTERFSLQLWSFYQIPKVNLTYNLQT